MSRGLRRGGAVLVALLAMAALPATATGAPPSAIDRDGARIYRAGLLPGGADLVGRRASGADVAREAAACVNCHRRSGLGNVEGDIVIPPIIAKYLFRSRLANVEDMTLPHVPGFTPNAWTYTDQSLATAIRTGVRPDGSTMNPLMPRYALDDPSMAALIAYLKDLTSAPVPGVSETALQFATIITPDADPVAKKAMLDVLQRFFAVQEKVIAAETRPLRTSREIHYRVTRQWQLHVWELAGTPDTWEAQLDAHLATQPVFAVISGLGGHDWRPVHRFCEHNAVPCLLPNVDLPVVAERDFYPVYYSRGVLLEADLIAARLASDRGAHRSARAGRLVQVFRDDDIGAAAAAALAARPTSLGTATAAHRLSGAPDAPAQLRKVLQGLGADDVLVLWLRPDDLAALPDQAPAAAVFASGIMGGLEAAPLPVSWRARTHLSYPFDPPDLRRVRMNFPLGWFRVQGMAVTAERVQTDTYLACVILSETLGHMLDSFVREYLVERMEMMLSRRIVNGYYPRLGLAPGQRFASKGGYLVHLAEGNHVVLEGDWITP